MSLGSPARRTVLVIIGMRDNSCRERLCTVLARVKGVHGLSVSLVRARAVVEHDAMCNIADLVWAIVNAGYGAAMGEREDPGRSSVSDTG